MEHRSAINLARMSKKTKIEQIYEHATPEDETKRKKKPQIYNSPCRWGEALPYQNRNQHNGTTYQAKNGGKSHHSYR